MSTSKNVVEVYKHLEQSNCRECGEKTCLAFAAAVFSSRKHINQCPRVDSETIALYSDDKKGIVKQDFGEQHLEGLKQILLGVDLAQTVERVGGKYEGRYLTLKIMGKDFGVDSVGNFSTDIHVNPPVSAPFLEYVIYSKGIEPQGDWVTFRELKEAKNFSYPFFKKRCEVVLKRIADNYTDLFEDLVNLFGGRKVPEQFESDVSVILYPFPKVPIMICYWGDDDGLGSTLSLFFDKSVDENLPSGSLFTLCVGFTAMLEKLTERHASIA